MSDRKTKGTAFPEEKAKRIAVAATVAGVLLILFLVIVLIVQFVQIGVRNSERRRLQESIDRYEQLIAEGEDNLEFYQSEQGLYWLALQHKYQKK